MIKSGPSLELEWKSFPPVVNEALYLESEKEWWSIDGDPKKSFCSKVYVHVHWYISSSLKWKLLWEFYLKKIEVLSG